eukprot:g3316.t1
MAGDHLVVVSHGMWGKPFHTDYLSRTLEAALPPGRTRVLNLTVNAGLRSYSGSQTAGARAAEVVQDEAKKMGSVRAVSFIGYSAGGLWLQHAATLLDQAGFFDRCGWNEEMRTLK